jgi:5-methylcytosine-specific restriction endonuclease McrA
LRTEEGWPITTKNTGRPELPIGVYVLEEDRQLPAHDRNITDGDRVLVLERDGYQCTNPDCQWDYARKHPNDPRQYLELHHIIHHASHGSNLPKNLLTLCNVCHDRVHSGDLQITWV